MWITESAPEAFYLFGDKMKNGFFRQQVQRLAIRFISAQYQKQGKPIPNEEEMKRQAARIVDEAHRIARQRGQNVLSILKDFIHDLKK